MFTSKVLYIVYSANLALFDLIFICRIRWISGVSLSYGKRITNKFYVVILGVNDLRMSAGCILIMADVLLVSNDKIAG